MYRRRKQAQASGRSSTGSRPSCGLALERGWWAAPNRSSGRRVAFSVEQRGQTLLYVMNVDGTQARVIASALSLLGTPAWHPSGDWITSSALVNGSPRLFRIALDGTASQLGSDYAIDPHGPRTGASSSYSGPQHRHLFRAEGVNPAGAPYAMPKLTLTRGTRRVRFIEQGRALVVARAASPTRSVACRFGDGRGASIDPPGV